MSLRGGVWVCVSVCVRAYVHVYVCDMLSRLAACSTRAAAVRGPRITSRRSHKKLGPAIRKKISETGWEGLLESGEEKRERR